MKFFAFAMMLCCVLLPGAEIPLDSSFTALSAPQDAPVNWTREFGHQGGFGICRILSGTPCNMLQVLTFAKLTNFYYKDMFKVVPGDRVTLEAEVCGEGGFCMTLYLYASSDITALPRRLTELKGKVVILDFTIYQSAVSASHNYMLRELYDKYASQGLEIYQVSLDADEHYWKTTADNLPWICVRDANGVYSSIAAAYNVQNMPSIFLVNRNNELSVRGELIKDLEAEVKKLL